MKHKDVILILSAAADKVGPRVNRQRLLQLKPSLPDVDEILRRVCEQTDIRMTVNAEKCGTLVTRFRRMTSVVLKFV